MSKLVPKPSTVVLDGTLRPDRTSDFRSCMLFSGLVESPQDVGPVHVLGELEGVLGSRISALGGGTFIYPRDVKLRITVEVEGYADATDPLAVE